MNGCAHFDIITETKKCSIPWNQQLDSMHRICKHCKDILEVGPRSGRSRRSAENPLCPLGLDSDHPMDLSRKITCNNLPSPHYPVYFFTFIILACVFSIASVTLSSVSLSSTSIDAVNAVVSEPMYFFPFKLLKLFVIVFVA
jgi:hypothetical protein